MDISDVIILNRPKLILSKVSESIIILAALSLHSNKSTTAFEESFSSIFLFIKG